MSAAFGNAQDIGRRDEQQDACSFGPLDGDAVAHAGVVGVVSDGMGGLARGGEASRIATRMFLSAYAQKVPAETIAAALERAMAAANEAVAAFARSNNLERQTGATLVAVVLHGTEIHWISAGDSRAYLLRDGAIHPLTTDHVRARQVARMVLDGRATRDAAAHDPHRDTLTSCLGLDRLPEVDASARPLSLAPGELILCCSDGLYRALDDAEIGGLLQAHAGSPLQACDALVRAAVAKGDPDQDNITALVLSPGHQGRAIASSVDAARRGSDAIRSLLPRLTIGARHLRWLGIAAASLLAVNVLLWWLLRQPVK